MTETERAAWCAWLRVPHIGPRRFALLRNAFPSMLEAWQAPASALRTALELEGKRLEEVIAGRQEIQLDAILPAMEKIGASVLTLLDANYPTLLKEIYAAPPVLYVRGTVPEPNRPALAVVGTRAYTNFGKVATAQLIEPVAAAEVVIVSGLALGIDGCAHQAALDAGGRTVAVLGSGVDVLYPPQHAKLAAEIVAHGGAVVSEFAPGTIPEPGAFPRRNRIVCGWSQATLVVEAGVKSGALLTAREALEQNREVLAVPGDFTRPTSVGPNELIKNGATPITSAEDILRVLAIEKTSARSATDVQPDDPPEIAAILKNLRDQAMHVDELAALCDLDPSVINASLVLLEVRGRVKHLGSLRYVRK
ncbi:MAG: DNA-processing protein DprA [Patescibacteria group bacterium]